MTHTPSPDACLVRDGDHWCDRYPHAYFEHACACGHTWKPDPELEDACRAYVAFYSVHYTDEAHVPSHAVVLAACTPADSPWRRVARAVGGRA